MKLAVFLIGVTFGFNHAVAQEKQSDGADNGYLVAISQDLDRLEVKHRGVPVTIKRIQDTEHRLTDDFTKTSRVCPPFCIQPIQIAEGVKTIGELELLDIMNGSAAQGETLVIDARMPQWFQAETIPTAINVPFTAYAKSGKAIMKLFKAKDKGDGSHAFDDAFSLVIFCNGPWCDQSHLAIEHLLKLGYPPEKLYYYRGGMQSWKSFGLTTIVPNPNIVSQY